jgi:aryl-alcohol dehydrogenase-like predicted oxidoreductase
LPGKYNNGIPKDSRLNQPSLNWLKESLSGEEGEKKLKKLSTVASEIGVPLNHWALSWCLSIQNVSTVILGASNAGQLKDNLKPLEIKKVINNEGLQKIGKL